MKDLLSDKLLSSKDRCRLRRLLLIIINKKVRKSEKVIGHVIGSPVMEATSGSSPKGLNQLEEKPLMLTHSRAGITGCSGIDFRISFRFFIFWGKF